MRDEECPSATMVTVAASLHSAITRFHCYDQMTACTLHSKQTAEASGSVVGLSSIVIEEDLAVAEVAKESAA